MNEVATHGAGVSLKQAEVKVRVGLVGCVSTKAPSAAQAKDLYTSTLFRGRRDWVEKTCDAWFILSAKYGLVLPTQVIDPYEVSLTDAPIEFKHDWADHVTRQLRAVLGDLSHYDFEIHAGSAYRDFGLVQQLKAAGALVLVPAEGLRVGSQLELYRINSSHEHTREDSMAVHPAHSTHTHHRSSYNEIGRRLLEVEDESVSLSMVDLEEIIGRFLPNSARAYREWWANTERSPQARGWLSAGWRVEAVDRERELVHFSRNPEGYVPKVGRRPKRHLSDAGVESGSSSEKIVKTGLYLENFRETKGCNYRWPKTVEHFSRCFSADLHIGSTVHQFKHAIGERYLFGELRVHSVTFLDGRPVVEGAGCDDFRISRSLVSFIRDGENSMLMSRDELPAFYKDFDVVFQSDEIVSPDSRSVLAVKIREDDVAHWALHAAIRKLLIMPTVSSAKVAIGIPDAETSGQRESSARIGSKRTSLSGRAKKLTADILVRFQGEIGEARLPGAGMLSSTAEGDQLLQDEPFAFLVGVICDGTEGSAMSWDVPLLLKERMGHLDPHRIRADYIALRKAMVSPEPLLPHVNDVSEAIAEAADRVVRIYGGDASRIWSNRPNPTQLMLRLERFAGIGKKKAQVATEILTRFLGVDFSNGVDVEAGFDNQVRRVFARVGLTESDQRDEVINAARRLYPTRPIVLDQSAWEVGRRWCTPSEPNCIDCILKSTCLRLATAGSA